VSRETEDDVRTMGSAFWIWLYYYYYYHYHYQMYTRYLVARKRSQPQVNRWRENRKKNSPWENASTSRVRETSGGRPRRVERRTWYIVKNHNNTSAVDRSDLHAALFASFQRLLLLLFSFGSERRSGENRLVRVNFSTPIDRSHRSSKTDSFVTEKLHNGILVATRW